MQHHPMLEAVVSWARHEDAVRAVVITGSLARADGTTDEYSDLDAQIISTDIKRYTDDDSWLDGLGEVWIRFPLFLDVPYRLVWFADGIKIDFQFITPESVRAQANGGTLSDEYQRGYLVALDKDALYRDLPPSPRIFPPPEPPDADAINATINEFWFEAIHVAQFIRRREFWVAKYRDWTMKRMLLRLLEWQARATKGHQLNTWLLGKRIRCWTDDDTYAEIERIWTRWDATDMWDGLLAQLTLCRRLSRELMEALAYSYADGKYHEIETYIRRLAEEDSGGSAKD